MINQYIKTWGICNYIPKNNLEQYIHPDDIQLLQTNWGNAALFYCEGIENEYLKLTKEKLVFRIKPDLYHVVEKYPSFHYNDIVKEKIPPNRIASIEKIGWHFNKKEPVYILKMENKIKSKWYFADELELVTKSQE